MLLLMPVNMYSAVHNPLSSTVRRRNCNPSLITTSQHWRQRLLVPSCFPLFFFMFILKSRNKLENFIMELIIWYTKVKKKVKQIKRKETSGRIKEPRRPQLSHNLYWLLPNKKNDVLCPGPLSIILTLRKCTNKAC